jgi:hypothetical protein
MISAIPLGGSSEVVSFRCGTLPATTLSCALALATVTLNGVNTGTARITVSAGSAAALAASRSTAWGVVAMIARVGLLLPFGRRKKLERSYPTPDVDMRTCGT